MPRGNMTYAAREDVQNALDIGESVRSEAQIDRVLRAASDSVERLTRRRFYPERRTMTFDWPLWDNINRTPWKLYLDQHELISVETLISGGNTIAEGDYFLRPDDGPPFRRVELNTATSALFDAGDSHQRSIEIDGTYGFNDAERDGGELAGGVAQGDTAIEATDGSLVGVGHLLRINDERMTVLGRSFIDSGAALAADLGPGDSTITVDDVSGLNESEILLIGGERLRITDIAGSTVAVQRGWAGTTLASASSGATVSVSRELRVERGVLGTDATTHSQGDAVAVHIPPPLVIDLCVAEAMAQLLQERTGYGRTVGTGENEREARNTGLNDLRGQVRDAYGRQARMRVV